MLNLQHSFSVDKTSTLFTLKQLYLNFRFQPIEYRFEAENSPTRNTLSEETIELYQSTDAKNYSVALPTSAVVGTTDASAKPFLRFMANHLEANSDVADIFSLSINVQVRSEDNIFLENAEPFDVIYFIKGLSLPVQYVSSNAGRIIQSKSDREAMAFVRENLFLINKAAYSDLLAELRQLSGSDDQRCYLLHLLSYCVDLRAGQPKWNEALTQDETNNINDILNRMEFPDVQAVLDKIKAKFDDLFDFPLALNSNALQKVGGTFTLRPSDNSPVTVEQIKAYSLSLEYSTFDEDDQPVMETIFYDWSKNKNKLADNSLAFSFSELRPIVPAEPHEPIAVFVKTPDGMILWEQEYRAGSSALASLQIEVPLAMPAPMNGGENNATLPGVKRLRGRLLDLTQKAILKDALIVIQAKREGDTAWHVISSAQSDTGGNFSMPYPYGKYVAAQAVVSLTPDHSVEIPVDKTRGDSSLSDDFLFLLLEDVKPPEKVEPTTGAEDCGCETTKTTRLPDHAELIGSDEYSQDLGTGCISLSTPNRTLSEYSHQAIVRTSDPDVSNYRLHKREDGSFELLGENKKIKRRAVDLTNPIRWQDAPDAGNELSFYQAVTVATGHILHYKSMFKADGYSLGEVLYSLPLAPGQKKLIVIFDSKHSLEASESQQMSLSERMSAGITNDRSLLDQINGRIGEGLRGNSSANTAGVSVGLGVAASAGYASGSLGISGGYSNSESNASQDSARDISQFFQEKLRNNVMQNADSYRQQNAAVITSVTQGEQYSASTEVVANHNHCHAMTMMYFEVLRHYAVYQELTNVEECVFVPLLMTNFTTQNIYKWQDVLAQNLLPLPSNTYIADDEKHPLIKGFDAIERKNTNYAEVDFPEGPFDEEVIRWIKGNAVIRVELPRPQTRYDRIKSFPIGLKSVSHEEFDPEGALKKAGVPTSPGDIFKSIFTFGISTMVDSANASTTKTVTEQVQAKVAIFDSFMKLGANFETVPPAQCISITSFQPRPIQIFGVTVNVSGPDFFDHGHLDRQLWEAYANILGYGSNVYDLLDYYFKDKLIADWDDIFYRDLAPALFEKILSTLTLTNISTDFSSTRKYRGGEQWMAVNLTGSTNLTRAQLGDKIYFSSNSSAVQALNSLVTLTVEDLTITYSTAHYNGLLFSGHLGDDLADTATLYTPESAEDKRNPKKEDTYLANKLIKHLNSNLEHYNKALWYSLDPDRRYMLLDGFNIQIFNSYGVPIGLKSLASIIKNELISVVGNTLVFPVASGFKVNKSYITERTDTGSIDKISLLDHYKPLTPIPPYRISAPTRGVFAEAVMGQCNSCEKVQEHTSQDWDKFKADEPTTINALTPPTPTVTDWKAAFKDFAAPLVGMQTAPVEAAPGAGLAGLSALLGKADSFNNITGLDKNQDNAMKTYQSNQENAKAFAEMAKGMAMQAHNTDNSEKIMDTLKEAKASGALTADDHSKMVKKHIDQQIDGGEGAKLEAEKATATKPSLTDAAVKAAAEGNEVKAEEKDTKGNVKSVQITPKKTAPASPPKKYYKTIYFKAVDCYGEPMRADISVYVNDGNADKEVGFEVFEYGTGSKRIGFSVPAPTVQIHLAASYQPDAVTPILTPFSYDSDPIAIPEAQAAITVTLKQSSFKKTIQTKETSLSAEKVLDETSGKVTIEVSSKQGTKVSETVSAEVNEKVAGEIAHKHSKEVSVAKGADEMNQFEVTVPTSHYELTVK
ncbi:MAG: hypothetical protein V4525_14020 [Pseudomonadota bacterium]